MPRNYIYKLTLFVIFLMVRNVSGNGDRFTFFRTDDHDTYSTTAAYPELSKCLNLKQQDAFAIKNILGLWYGNEIIEHTQEMPFVYNYNFCVHVVISDITEQFHDSMGERIHKENFNANNSNRRFDIEQKHPLKQDMSTRYLRFVWTENNNNLEYNFNYTPSSPGLWHNNAEQRGSLARRPDYKQFHGDVHVQRALNNYILLTFCATDAHRFAYSLVLTRNMTGLNKEELRNIRNLLTENHLPTGSVGKVCKSRAMRTHTLAMHNVFFTLFLFYIALHCFIFGVGKFTI